MVTSKLVRVICVAAVSACSTTPPALPEATSTAPTASDGPGASEAPKKAPIDRAREALAASNYAEAEKRFLALRGQPGAAQGLAHTLFRVGRYDEAYKAAAGMSAPDETAEQAILRARCHHARGRLKEAEAELRAVYAPDGDRSVRLWLGDLLLEQGRARDAEAILMTLVEEYNDGKIDDNDASGIALVGRAAFLLGSPADANDAFNESERVEDAARQTLLWRTELFMAAHDPGHAEETVSEILQQAPNDPDALVWSAHIQLAQSLDFDRARRLATRAHAQNPRHTGVHFVFAGIELRDMHIEEAEAHLDAGLKENPRDLDLLSLRATSRFLADDDAGFEAAKTAVLDLNPHHTRLFHIIGEYAEWEHRYDEIIELMREALLVSTQDAKVRAQLGFNLIRAGEEKDGLASLRRSFDLDPFNVRVFNTLNLYEKEIANHYVTVEHGHFRFRYHGEEESLLERYVPGLMEEAWGKMRRAYRFTPTTPIGIELYAQRQHFAVRTSGLPHTFIQGVCFGRTLAAVSPKNETFNLGMTLWHELAHVFHIQLSKSRVPRWFTEGLAEYETLVERREWKRELDHQLYQALREGRLPEVGAMNQAFSHARDMSDMATAYYASTRIVAFMAETFGRKKLREMLVLWSKGLRTEEVIERALGVGTTEFDARFREHARTELSHFAKQYVPPSRPEPVAVTKAATKKASGDAEVWTRHALALLTAGDAEAAQDAVDRALKLDARLADARWLSSQLALDRGDTKKATAELKWLAAQGHDGYAIEMTLAKLAGPNLDEKRRALEAAHTYDPLQSEPLAMLAAMARDGEDRSREIELLGKLAEIDEHDPAVFRRLMQALIAEGQLEEARDVGRAAVWVDVEGLETHLLYGEALSASGKLAQARFELESAARCEGSPPRLAEVHARLAQVNLRMGRRGTARRHARKAKELDADNATLKGLKW